jgi:hypothetical protein
MTARPDLAEYNRRVKAGKKHPDNCNHCRLMRENPPRQGTGKLTDYRVLHEWIRKQRGRASYYTCDVCGAAAHEWANVTGRYERDPFAYASMCRSCHRRFDAAMRKHYKVTGVRPEGFK